MADLVIVDGYNLMHASDRYKKWLKRDLETARIKMIEDLATLKMSKDWNIILVFDAGKTQESSRNETNILGVEVVFTRSGETADEYIERLVYTSDYQEGNIIVATSDYNQQRVVFIRGALRKSARELIMDLEESDKELKMLESSSGRFRLEERLDGAIRNALNRIIGKD